MSTDQKNDTRESATTSFKDRLKIKSLKVQWLKSAQLLNIHYKEHEPSMKFR